MSENFNNQYEQLSSNPEFSAMFGSKTEFENFMNENPDASDIMRDAFNVNPIEMDLKKKEETESFTSPSPSVGQTIENVDVAPQPVAQTPQLGVQDNNINRQPDPYLNNLRNSLQTQIEKISKNQSPFGAFMEIQKLSKSAEYQKYKNAGKLDDLLGSLNTSFNDVFLQNPSYSSSFNTPNAKKDLENIGITSKVSVGKGPVKTPLQMASEQTQADLDYKRKQEIEARLYSGGDIAQRGKPGYRVEQEAKQKENAENIQAQIKAPKETLSQAYATDFMGRRVEKSESRMEEADEQIQPLVNDLRDYVYLNQQRATSQVDQESDEFARQNLANKIYDKIKDNIVPEILSDIKDNYDDLNKEGVFFRRDIDGFVDVDNGYIADKIDKYFLGKEPGEKGYIPNTPEGNEYRYQLRGIIEGRLRAEYRAQIDKRVIEKELGKFSASTDEKEVENSILLIKNDIDASLENKQMEFEKNLEAEITERTKYFQEQKSLLDPKNFGKLEQYNSAIKNYNDELTAFNAEVAERTKYFEEQKSSLDPKNFEKPEQYNLAAENYNKELAAYNAEVREKTKYFEEQKSLLEPKNFEALEQYNLAVKKYNDELTAYNVGITNKIAQFGEEFSKFQKLKKDEYSQRLDELGTIFQKRTSEEFKEYNKKALEVLNKYKQSQVDKNAFDFGDGNKYGIFADFVQSSLANFMRSSLEMSGVKDLDIGFVNRTINDMATFASGNAYAGNSLSNARSFSEGFGAFAQQMIDQLPTIGGGALATYLTGNPYLASTFLMYTDMARESVSVRDEILNSGGSVADADRASKRIVQAHLGMMPFYFAQGSLLFGNKVGSTAFWKNYLKATPLEYAVELTQEITQQYTSDKETGKLTIQSVNPTTGEVETRDKTMLEYLATTGKDLAIDVLPTVATFGGVQARGETTRALKVESDYADVSKFLGDSHQLDYFNDLYSVMGENAAYALPDMLRFRGEITQQQYDDLKNKLPNYIQKIQEVQDAGILNLDDSRYYLNRLQEKEMLEQKLKTARTQTSKNATQIKLDEVNQNIDDVIKGKELSYTKISFANGMSVVLDNKQVDGYLNNLENPIARVLTNEFRDGNAKAKPIATLQTDDAKLNKKLNKLFDLKKEREGEQTVEGVDLKVENKIDFNNDDNIQNIANENNLDEAVVQSRFNQAKNAQAVLNEKMSGVEIVLLADKDFKALMPKVGGNVNSNGNFAYTYDKKTKRYKAQIQINLDKSNSRTINHELTHALLLQKFGEDVLAFQDFRQGLTKVMKNSDIKNLEEFTSQYNELDKFEEFMAEAAGLLSQEYEGSVSDLKKSKLQNIASYISKYVSNLTGGTVNLFRDLNNTDAAIEFFNTLSQKTNATQETPVVTPETQETTVTPTEQIQEEVPPTETIAEPEVVTEETQQTPQEITPTETIEEAGEVTTTFTPEEQIVQQEEVANFVENADETNIGIATPVNPKQNFTNIQSKAQIGKYGEAIMDGVSFSNELPKKTLKQIAQQYDGRLFIITSDGTGYGIDSEGNPIYGGFGFVTHPQNQKDGVGFASVDVSTVKSTITAIRKFYGNQKVGVLVMIQPPYTTINNSYGAHYFIRAMKSLASDPTKLTQAKNSFKEWVMSNKGVLNNLRKESAKDGKRNTLSALFKMIDSINSNTDVNEFTKEFLKDTTFDSRKGILQGLLPDRGELKINKSTPTIKKLLLEAGFNTENFLAEYGDKTFLTEDLIAQDKGGFVVGGFEIDVKPEEEMNKQIEDLQSKGFVHPLFNGKLPGTNHFALDGIYPVNENFAKFSKPQRVFNFAKISELFSNENLLPEERPKKKSKVVEGAKYASDKRDELVRKNYKEEKSYDEDAVQKIKEQFSPSKKINFAKDILPELGYTNLKSANKIEFKQTIGEDLGILMDKQSDVATDVARGTGFQPVEGAAEQLKTTEFTKGFGSKSQLTEPSTDKWSQSLTQQEVDARLAESGIRTKSENDRLLQETKKGNETQRNNISTYSAFVNGLINKIGKDNITDVSILDAGAGFGIGAKAAANANIASSYNTFEPFPSISDGKWEKFSGTKEPNFTNFGDVENSSQDVVVSNAVLNVVPADIRQSIVENIGRVMKPGAEAYISVRGIKESALVESLNAAKSGKSKNVFLSDSEYYVPGTQGDYQKGFSETELQGYIQDVLGDQYNVEISKEPFWKSNSSAPKVLVTKNAQFTSKSQLDANQINAEFNQITNEGGSVSDALDNLIDIGYGKKDIQEQLGKNTISDDFYNQRITQKGFEAFNKIRDVFADNKAKLLTEIENMSGMDIADIRADLKQNGYNDVEIFNAMVSGDFALNEDLENVFGAEFRKTIANLFEREGEVANLEFLEDLTEEGRALKSTHKLGDIAGMFQESGLVFADASVMIEYLMSQMALPTEVAAKEMRRQLGELLDKLKQAPEMFEKEVELKEDLLRYSNLLSFAGRILATGRNLFPKSMASLIEQSLAKEGIVLTQKQKETLASLVADFNTATATEKQAQTELNNGDLSDQAFQAYQAAQKNLGLANVRLMQFLNNRKPTYWNEVLTSGGSRGLLNLSTVVLSITSNIENLLYSSYDPNGIAIRKLRDSFKDGIAGNTLSFNNWRLAYSLSRRNSLNEMNLMAKYGALGSVSDKNFDSFGTVNFFREPQIVYKWVVTQMEKFSGKQAVNMTDEEFVDAMDLTLQRINNQADPKVRSGRTYNIAKAMFMSSFGIGSQVTEGVGRTMAYGGDILFGKLAATRAMLDYFSNINNEKFSQGLFENFLDGKNQLSKESMRSMISIMSTYAELNSKFEQAGLKRVFMNDNGVSKMIGKGRMGLKQKVRQLGAQINKGEEKKLSLAAAKKQVYQVGDVAFWTLMPFIKVPTNFLGSAISKTVPFVSMPKYVFKEFSYRRELAEFNKKYPEGKKISDNKKKAYETAKVDLFLKKRDLNNSAAEVITSIELSVISMMAYASGALLTGGSPEKEKRLKESGLKGNSLNVTLFIEFIKAALRNEDLKNFAVKRGGDKKGDFMMSLGNAGFMGYSMGLWGSVLDSVKEGKNSNIVDVMNPESGIIGVMMYQMFGNGVQNLPMLQGVARVGELLKKDESGNKMENFISGTLSTSLATFFPSFGSFKSKAEAENIQTIGDINTEAEDFNLPTSLGRMSLGVVQKLSRNVPFDTGYNPYYKAAIGVMGEDLSNRVTIAEPGSWMSYVDAMFNPFQFRRWSPGLRENEDSKLYEHSTFIQSNLIKYAQMYKQITGRTYDYTYDGKSSDFYTMMTMPVKNELEYDGTGIVTEYSDPNTPNKFKYSLPNDLYREELRKRGQKVYNSTQSLVREFNAINDQIRYNIFLDNTELVKDDILKAFETYKANVQAANDGWKSDYTTNREKKYLKIMYDRGVIDAEPLKRVGILK
jgi:SAM-dependent methyltransferase